MKTQFKKLVDESGLTIDEVLDELNTSKSTYYRLYNETAQSIRFDVLKNICEFFNITPNEFFNSQSWNIGISDDELDLNKLFNQPVIEATPSSNNFNEHVSYYAEFLEDEDFRNAIKQIVKEVIEKDDTE